MIMCIVTNCGKVAEYIFKGESLCSGHFRTETQVIRPQTITTIPQPPYYVGDNPKPPITISGGNL